MQELFQKYSLDLDEKEIELFEKFLEIFMEKNSQINLSAIRTPDAIIEKHFVDSIMLNIFLDFETPVTQLLDTQTPTPIRVLDLWTGWGFPMIPLAIVNPHIEFMGIDSVWKKLIAVDDFAQTLWLHNVKTLKTRAEEIGQDPKYRASFTHCVSRATAFLPVLLEYVIPILKVGWIFVAYKLEDKEELKASKKALSRLSAKILKVKNYTIDGQKRTFIFIEKLQPTHKKYPRKIGIPLQRPIQ